VVSDLDTVCRQAEDLAAVGRFGDAERIVRTALAEAPDDAELLTVLSYLLRRQERFLDALAASDAAAASAPDHAEAHAQRAWTLISIHRAAQAITAASEAVRLGPHVAASHLVLAEALLEDDRLDEARDSVREVLRLRPGSVAGLLTLAEIERSAGNASAAGRAAEQALALDPSSTQGRRIAAMIDADRGVVRRSMRILAGIARDQPADPNLSALLWPVRRVVAAPRWWLPGAAAVTAALALMAVRIQPEVAFAARTAAALTGAVTVGFALRMLLPAGRVPWKALRLATPLVRLSIGIGLAAIVVAVGLLTGYATGGPMVLLVLTVAAGPVLWVCTIGEGLGHSLNSAGDRQFLQDWRSQTRSVLRDIGEWPAETRQSLHTAWHAGDEQERKRKEQHAELLRPLAVYRDRQRNTVLSAAFAIVGAAALACAFGSRPSTAGTVVCGLLALLTLYTSARVAVMKAIATPQELILDGPWWKAIVTWDRVAHVTADQPKTTRGLLVVRSPVLLLADGRRFTVKQAAAYDLRARRSQQVRAQVAQMATELEAIRLAHTSRAESSPA
jgi:tetratricopeptide (TPR) repeat protein